MDLLEALKMSLLNFNFFMIYIIQKMLLLIKNNLNYLNDSVSEWFFKEFNSLIVKNYFFSKYILMESWSLKEENINKDRRNFFWLKRTKLHCN